MTKIVRISIDFWIPEFDQLTIQKSMKFAQQSVQNSCHLWSSLLKVRSKFWFLDLFEFRSLKIASLGAQRTLPGRSRGTPGARRGRSRSSPSTPWAPWGAPGGSRDRFPVDFGCPRDQNCLKFDQHCLKFRLKFRSPELIECRSRFRSK